MNYEDFKSALDFIILMDQKHREVEDETFFRLGAETYSVTELRELLRKEEERVLHEHRMKTCNSYRALKTPFSSQS